MPELAEVAWFARQWAPGRGARVTEVLCRGDARVFRAVDVRALRAGLEGRRLTEMRTHGKQMLFGFEGVFLGVHLGMTGELRVAPGDHEPGRHDHLVLRQSRRSLVFRDPRMFGSLKFHPGPVEPPWWTDLPPDILSRGFTLRLLAAAARRRKASPLKAFLLQQDVFPGIGNWMADEILWRCRLPPSRRTGTLDNNESSMLWREVRRLCRDALRSVGEDWGDPPESWLFQHRWKAGGRCPRDGSVLRREEIGGRTTAWCRECQGK